jgi:CTP synthase
MKKIINKKNENKEIGKLKRKLKETKYIFVVGGVLSGVGKGVTSSSLAMLYKSAGYKVSAVKIDPYVNVDAGTMNPTEHGEVFVLGDGDECDQDMGNYERFLNENLYRENYMTTGRVYQSVIQKEREMKYKGICVEVVPHIPMEVIDRIENVGKKNDIVLVEIGGTVGEYQNLLFLEAIRMMRMKRKGDVAIVMVSYLPEPGTIGEMKTKPTQHAVRALNSVGLYPQLIVARATSNLDEKRKEKLAMFCGVPKDRIVSGPDVESIYGIPVNLHAQKVDKILAEVLNMKNYKQGNVLNWKKFFSPTKQKEKNIKIGMIGKYFSSGDGVLKDAYLSVFESIKYAAYSKGFNVEIGWISAEDFEGKDSDKKLEILKEYDGVVVPGGFGERGVEGIIRSIKYIRENKIPFLGICYGLQLAVIEFARNVVGLKDAHTTEVNKKTKNPIINILEDQKEKMKSNNFGNSMRLGEYKALVEQGTTAFDLYKKTTLSHSLRSLPSPKERAFRQLEIIERHRHRYEVDPKYHEILKENKMIISGISEDGTLAEIIELPKEMHPYFMAGQFHPEFLSRPLHPHPLFVGLAEACIGRKK